MEVKYKFERSGTIKIYKYKGHLLCQKQTNSIGILKWDCPMPGYYTFKHSGGPKYSIAKAKVVFPIMKDDLFVTGEILTPSLISDTNPTTIHGKSIVELNPA